MEQVWFSAAVRLGLALFATLLSIWLRIAVVLTEIVGTIAQLIMGTAAVAGSTTNRVVDPASCAVLMVHWNGVIPTHDQGHLAQ